MPLPRRPRTPGRPARRPTAGPTAVAVAAAVLTACGGTAAPAPGTAATTTAGPSPHKHTPGMRMNGDAPAPAASGPAASGATPSAVADARTVTGRRLTRGTLAPDAGRPAGTRTVAGTAWLAAGTTGTTVTVEVSGLPARTWFMVHLQVAPCSDPDAAAFAFPAAAGGPAHELHVMFATRDDGSATVSGEDPADAGGAVRSVAVLPESMSGRVACADLA